MAQTLFARIAAYSAFQMLWHWIEPLFRPGLRYSAARILPVSALPVTEDNLRRLAVAAGPVRAELEPGTYLERYLTLPRVARAEANRAIALQLRRSLPQGGRGLVWRAVPSREAGDRLQWRVLIVKEAHLADLAARAIHAGIPLREIGLAKLDAPPLWEANPPSANATRNWAAATILGVVLVAFVAVVLTSLHARNLEAIAAAREGRVMALRDRLAKVDALGANAAERQRAFASQWADYVAGARPVSFLGHIADALPQDVWLSELSMVKGEWRLSGFTKGDVGATITALQALPFASNVRLDGPVSHDSYSNQSRFELVLTETTATAKVAP